MQVLRLDGFLLLSLPLPGLGIHCSFSSWIQLPSRTLWEGSCDGSGLKVGLCRCSVSMVSFYYLSLSLSLSLSLPPTLLSVRFSFSVLFPSFLDFRVQSALLLLSLFPVYRSRIYYSTAFSFYVSGSDTLSSIFPALLPSTTRFFTSSR